MLMQLEGRSVTNVCAVVVRYFGDTKLGVGGLVRAYGGAVAEALDRADIVEVVLTRRVRAIFDYELTNAVDAFLHARGVEPVAKDYGSEVRFEFELPIPEVGDIPVPTALLLGGVLVGFLTAWISRGFAGVGATRRSARARARIETAVTGVADELVVAPIDAELADLRRLDQLLEVAGT